MIRLVARREFTERVRERSFLISTGLTLVIIVIVVALPALFGFGDPSEYRISADAGEPCRRRARGRARRALRRGGHDHRRRTRT